MLKIVESGIDPIDNFSRWWKVVWVVDGDHFGSCILKCAVAHCCTLAAIQNVYLTYGNSQAETFFAKLRAFLEEFPRHRDEAVKAGIPRMNSPLWEPKTWVYFNSSEERIDPLLKAIPQAKIVHSFKNTSHPPYNTVHQIMFEV